ncbi:MAG: hypothetical protein ACE37M_02630 [Henriciella sp.]
MTWGHHKPVEPARAEQVCDERGLKRVRLDNSSIELEVMIHGGERSELPPLLIMNSIEFPMPPSPEFCDLMQDAGYQVIFVRRPGFGYTQSLPAALLSKQETKRHAPIVTEAALIKRLIDTMGLNNIRLLGLGTSNSICRRLIQMGDEIDVCVFSNPLFNPEIWDVIRPAWLKRMIRQTVLSKSGLKIAVRGLRAVLRRDPIWFYHQFAQKSAGDLAYIKANEADFRVAAQFLQDLAPDVYFSELRSALIEDTEWTPDSLGTTNAVILSGHETTTPWKASIAAEAKRLELPISFANAGDLFVAYASPKTLIELLETHAAKSAVL